MDAIILHSISTSTTLLMTPYIYDQTDHYHSRIVTYTITSDSHNSSVVADVTTTTVANDTPITVGVIGAHGVSIQIGVVIKHSGLE